MPKQSPRGKRSNPSKSVVYYLVSGAEDIRPTDEIIRRTGRKVRHDDQVSGSAASELRPNKKYIVIAHGDADGTVYWFNSTRGSSQPWLWVKMPSPPMNARIYLYSCRVGQQLPRSLRHCESFGHVDVVPMPVDSAKDLVLAFLGQVENLMTAPHFDPEEWRTQLGAYVNRLLVQEIDNRTGILTSSLLTMLRRSLGYAD